MIGAGAAGTMAAIFAASSGARTLLLERTRDGGRKILISGGGRCNILPARLDESRFVSEAAPHLVRRIIRSWPLREQIGFFEQKLGLPLIEEVESAKLFPASQRAHDVRDRLLELARRKGVELRMETTVTGLQPDQSGWRVHVDHGESIAATAVVVATGGLSVPSTGSDGTGIRILEGLGHTIRPTYPALTPITAEPAPFASLAVCRCRSRSQRVRTVSSRQPLAAFSSRTAATAVRLCSTCRTSRCGLVSKGRIRQRSLCVGRG